MAQLFTLPRQAPLVNSSVSAGAKLEFFLTGTTTQADIYTDDDLTVAHSNPVIADSAGVFAPIYLDPDVTYKVTLSDSADVLQYTADPAASDSGGISYAVDPVETSLTITVVDSSYPVGAVNRYGENATPGTTDMSTAAQSAMDVIDGLGGGTVAFNPGETYLFSSQVTATLTQSGDYSSILVEGNGAIIKTSGAIAGLKVVGGGTLGNIVVRDLKIDHRANADATFGFLGEAAQHVIFENCKVVAGAGTSGTYACFKVTQSDLSDGSTGSFWARLIDCETRVLQGADADYQYGILVQGSCNDTQVIRGKITGAVEGVRFEYNATSSNVPNGCRIDGTAFEGNVTHINNVGGASLGGYIGPTVTGCRFEDGTNVYTESVYDTAAASPGRIAGNRYISNAGTFTLITAVIITLIQEDVVTPDFNIANRRRSSEGWEYWSGANPVHKYVPIGGAGNVNEWYDNAGTSARAAMEYLGGSEYMLTATLINSGLTLAGIRAASSTAGREGNNLSGSETLSSGTATVTFGTAEPDANYNIYLSGDANETFYWSSKATTGFTITSSNGSSTANVDWLIVGD